MPLSEKITRNLRDIAVALRSGPAARRKVFRRYLFDALRRVVPYVAIDTEDGLIVLATADRTISKAVFSSGQWQPEQFFRAIEIAEDRVGHPVWAGTTFVEVGANIGTTTLLAARKARRVVCFEPVPENYRLLRATLAANELEDRVQTVCAAVSDHEGIGFLAISDINSGEHRVDESGSVPTRLVRLDDALDETGTERSDIGLLWIDVEGHEASVFAGAQRLLEHPPPTVIEFCPRGLGETLRQLTGLIEQAFTSVIDLRTGQPTTLDEAASRYADTATDLLLLP